MSIPKNDRRNRGALASLGARLRDLLRALRGEAEKQRRYRNVIVETSSVCNIRCVWCWMYYSRKKDMGLMDVDHFKRFIDLNAHYLRRHGIQVTPYHRGEPLLHPRFQEMLEYASANRVSLNEIHTNLSMEIDVERLMAAPLRRIVVNIGGVTQEIHGSIMVGSDLQLVTKNLQAMLSIDRERVHLKMNPTRHNLCQIDRLGRFFEDLGGDPEKATISTMGFSPRQTEASQEDIELFFRNVVSDEMGPYLRFTYDDDRRIRPKTRGCPYMVPTVKWDGKVSMCCHDQMSKINLGNAFRSPLKDIFRSPSYKEAEKRGRRRELAICRYCT